MTEDTNLRSCTVQHLTPLLHDDKRATTPRQQRNLRLTHLQCSQYTWSQGNVTSSHAADSVKFCRVCTKFHVQTMIAMIHKNCDSCCQTQHRAAPSSTSLSKTSGIPLDAHPDSHSSNFSCLRLISPTAYSLVGHDSSSHEELLRISRSRLRRSSMSSSAAILHCASCRTFCKTVSDFLEACFVRQSAT